MRPMLAAILLILLTTPNFAARKQENPDARSIDTIVAAIYDAISGPPGKKRDWDRFRALFPNEGRLLAAVKSRSGAMRLITMTPDDYVKSSGLYLETKGFFEKEIARRTEAFGNIANVFSTYGSRHKAEDKEPFERGINNIELYNDGKRWWIVSIYWQGEDPTTNLPARYLRR